MAANRHQSAIRRVVWDGAVANANRDMAANRGSGPN